VLLWQVRLRKLLRSASTRLLSRLPAADLFAVAAAAASAVPNIQYLSMHIAAEADRPGWLVGIPDCTTVAHPACCTHFCVARAEILCILCIKNVCLPACLPACPSPCSAQHSVRAPASEARPCRLPGMPQRTTKHMLCPLLCTLPYRLPGDDISVLFASFSVCLQCPTCSTCRCLRSWALRGGGRRTMTAPRHRHCPLT
jgi:hypothetical protein